MPTPTSGLYLLADGTWLHDGDRVEHERLCALLHRSVALAADGTVVVTTGRDVLPFGFEDLPLRVLSIHAPPLRAVLSNERTEPLRAAQLEVDPNGSLRMRTSTGLWARVTRQAQLQLAPWLEEEPRGVVFRADGEERVLVPA
jgi:hypothetical protein